MKKFKITSILMAAFAMLLSACGRAADKTFDLTFHQTEAGPNEDFVYEVVSGVTTQEDVWAVEPEINEKVGYEAEWEPYDVLSMTDDLTVEPIYSLINYTATFKNRVNNQTLGTTTFTIADTELTNFPALPTEVGYTYDWESYTIAAEDIIVWCDRTANIHTLKFFEDEAKTIQVGETINFTCETTEINEPEVPVHPGYDGYWPQYDLTLDQDLEVVAEYVLHRYYLQFVFEGIQVGELVAYNVEDNYDDIIKPEAPVVKGYDVLWPENVTLQYCEIDNPQVIEGYKVAKEYTVSYEGRTETTTVTYEQPYELEAPRQGYTWYYGEENIQTTGDSWKIADDVTLVEGSIFKNKLFNFEDGQNQIVTLVKGFDQIEVVDGEGLEGSKALKVSRTTNSAADCWLTISADYLAAVFEDTSVKALEFSARGTEATNNFRHHSVDAEHVNGHNTIISCFEANSTAKPYGIDTIYKKFYLTRAIWEQMGSAQFTIQYGVTGAADLYIDNIKPATTDYFDNTISSFENGAFVQASGSGCIWNPIGIDDYLIRWNEIPTNVTFSYEHKTEGNRSLQFQKNSGENSFYIPKAMLNIIGEEGILFDVRIATTALNVGAVQAGNNSNVSIPTENGYSRFDADVWHTLQVKKSQMTADGRFIKFSWSTVATMYIDNIRIATSVKESFESAHGSQYGEYGYISSFKILNETEANSVRDRTKNSLILSEWKACTAAEVTTERATDGVYSAKLTLSKSGPIAIAPHLVRLMDDDSTITLDVYTDDMDITSPLFEGYEKGKWHTITITKADLDGHRFIHQTPESSVSAGTIYFDNLVFTM